MTLVRFTALPVLVVIFIVSHGPPLYWLCSSSLHAYQYSLSLCFAPDCSLFHGRSDFSLLGRSVLGARVVS